MTPTIAELQEIVKLHQLWIFGDEKGIRADLSGADLSRANLSRAPLDGAILRKANLSGADLSNTILAGADLRGADLAFAYLPRANLNGADLKGANLEDATLREADLTGADMTGARLFGANLKGVNLSFTSVVGFQLTKWFGFYHEGYVQIGCEGASLEYWLDNYKQIGETNNYTPIEISLVGDFLKLMDKYKL